MIALAPSLRPVVRPAGVAFDGLRIVDAEPSLDEPLAGAQRRVRESPPSERSDVRAMYRAVGLDPTRRRPSSEALLRRVLRGDALPRVNSLVDVCNWCSLEYQLPYGAYDMDAIAGPIELRLGREGEQYAGIRKDVVHLTGRLALADAEGPFGNPSSDSARTLVHAGTTRVLVVVFAPAQLADAHVAAVLDATSDRVRRFCGGVETSRTIV